MAHTLTTKKNIRVTARRTAVNRSRKRKIATYLRKAREAAIGGEINLARAAFVRFESELMKGVSKGVYKKNTAARKLKNLNKKIEK
ncbi:MAG: 30S ribosomal protein S20 [Rickettsiales bacterium]|jgi:small subunit ribosomal protein S20|nr:30S ribosomal protein S20 [Rickettsiales bacterium]